MSVVRPDFTYPTFWTNTAERIVRTAAQAALATFFTDQFTPASIPLDDGLKLVGFAALFTLLTALAGKATGDPNSPSFLLRSAPKVSDRPVDGGSTYNNTVNP